MTNTTVKLPPGRIATDLWLLILFGFINLLLHTLVNNRYGFHRDELATLDDARHLAFGYVAYPPLTPFVARIALTLFGSSLAGLRLFSALAMSAAMILTGLMARALGGARFAQILAALCVGVAPIVIIQGSLFQYVAFDYLWWTLIAYLMIKLLQSDDVRWWLAIGAVIGVGMLTKYTVAFFAIGIAVGVLVTKARAHLKSPWLWCGAALSLVIWTPNLLWQAQHHFISFDFLRSIHERDVRIGRTKGFLPEQFFVCANIVTAPLWLAGLWFYVRDAAGARYRTIAWMFVVPFTLFLIMRGRSYYLAPAYPMLFAAGGVLWERWIYSSSFRFRGSAAVATFILLLGSGALFAALLTPVAPVNSNLWKISSKVQGELKEEIGWDDLVDEVANVYRSLPEGEKARAGILAGNYGEAGAINLYGARRDLPQAISGVNSYWLRGYGDPPPETLVVVGLSEAQANRLFKNCRLAGHVTNRLNVENEETREHPDIFVCRELRQPWSEFWQKFRYFG
jgi:4-amino-4-deoxy-L-arabinose transferase-like glycosyltransferase